MVGLTRISKIGWAKWRQTGRVLSDHQVLFKIKERCEGLKLDLSCYIYKDLGREKRKEKTRKQTMRNRDTGK